MEEVANVIPNLHGESIWVRFAHEASKALDEEELDMFLEAFSNALLGSVAPVAEERVFFKLGEILQGRNCPVPGLE
jgi:hypothetical protein